MKKENSSQKSFYESKKNEDKFTFKKFRTIFYDTNTQKISKKYSGLFLWKKNYRKIMVSNLFSK